MRSVKSRVVVFVALTSVFLAGCSILFKEPGPRFLTTLDEASSTPQTLGAVTVAARVVGDHNYKEFPELSTASGRAANPFVGWNGIHLIAFRVQIQNNTDHVLDLSKVRYALSSGTSVLAPMTTDELLVRASGTRVSAAKYRGVCRVTGMYDNTASEIIATGRVPMIAEQREILPGTIATGYAAFGDSPMQTGDRKETLSLYSLPVAVDDTGNVTKTGNATFRLVRRQIYPLPASEQEPSDSKATSK